MEAGRATATYNLAAHAVAASDPDEPKCYEQYWMIKGVIGLVHDLGLSKYKSAPLSTRTPPRFRAPTSGKRIDQRQGKFRRINPALHIFISSVAQVPPIVGDIRLVLGVHCHRAVESQCRCDPSSARRWDIHNSRSPSPNQ
jgi:hypothetical protein